MTVDASAVIAAFKQEADAETYVSAMAAHTCAMSVANWFEASLVADHYSLDGSQRFDAIISDAGIQMLPVTLEQGRVAREAHRRIGRGSGSKARLNFGDCFAYALAVTSGEPLLFRGDDFTHTDVRSAVE